MTLLNIKFDEFLYYLAFAAYYAKCALERTTFIEFLFIPVGVYTTVAQIAVLLLLLFKFAMQRASFKRWVFSAFIVLVCFLSWRQSGVGWLFWAALFIVSSNGVRLQPLAKIVFALSLGTVAITMLFAGCGVIENEAYVRQGEIRYAMGFAHPNTFGLYLLNVCVSFSILRFGKSPLPDIVLIFISVVLNLAIANSRTTVLLSLVQVILLLVFYLAKEETRRKPLRYVIVALAFLVVAASAYFMVCYSPSNPIHLALNEMLSGRLRLAHGYYEMQPLTLFGANYEGFSPIYWENGKPYEFIVDNGWCHLILRYGIVPAALLIGGYFALLGKMLKQHRWDALMFGLILMCVYSFSESLGIRIECNFFLYAIGAELIYSNKLIREREIVSKPSSLGGGVTASVTKNCGI